MNDTNDQLDTEIALRTAFSQLQRKAPELAGELMTDFRQSSGNDALRHPADAPAHHHANFTTQIETCLRDIDCD